MARFEAKRKLSSHDVRKIVDEEITMLEAADVKLDGDEKAIKRIRGNVTLALESVRRIRKSIA